MTEKDASHMANALLALQQQYMDHVESESPKCKDSFNYYQEVAQDLRNKCQSSYKYAKWLLINDHFQEAWNTSNAQMYIPLLYIVKTAIGSHSNIARTLLKEHTSVVDLVLQELLLHCSWAVETLIDQLDGDKAKDSESPFDIDEALTIINYTVDILEVITDTGGRVMTRFIVREHPQMAELLEQCSQTRPSRATQHLIALFCAMADTLAKEERRLKATIIFQATWRAVLQRRKWKKMQRGFSLLQREFRNRQLRKELSITERFIDSEQRFERELDSLIKRRLSIEQKFRQLKEQPAANLVQLGTFMPRKEAKVKEEQVEGTIGEINKREQAATVIQCGVRQWLVRKQARRPLWSRSLLLQSNLNETKVRRFQSDIDLWQHKTKLPPMSPEEQAELSHKVQLMYGSFSKTVMRNRLEDHRAQASIAQIHAMVSVMESAPSLQNYSREQWSQFHSLPLPIAAKARLLHKEAMENVDKPKWMKLLAEYG